MDARAANDSQLAAVAAAVAGQHEQLMDSVAYDDGNSGDMMRKRELEGADDYDDDDDDESTEYSKDDLKDGKLGRGGKRSRRHNWQQKYEMEFGLLAIERDSVNGDVTLAMCGFCKAFGREGKYEQLLQADTDAGHETKKRRRRSLTTTKFFRAFRVDNIRSHLQGAHPRRWAEYEMLPKQESVRARFLQMQGEFQYDAIPMVDDVVLSSSSLNAESDIAYAQAQAQALGHASLSDTHHHQHHASAQSASPASLNGATPTGSSHLSPGMVYSGHRHTFDYDLHLTEQLALERERLAFEKSRFKKEVELRERELAQREKQLEQDRLLFEKQREAALENVQLENSRFARLAEVIRDAIASGNTASGGAAGPAASLV